MDIGYWIFVLGAGLTLGAFTSRFLAENCYHTLPGLNALPQTTLLSLAVTLILLAFWRLYSAACARRGKTPLAQACPEPCPERSRRDSRRALADDALTYIPLFLLLLYLIQRQVNPLQAKVLLCGSVLLVIVLKAKALLRIGIWNLEVGSWNLGLVIGHWSLVIGSGLFALTFVVYLSTLSPTLGEADSFEFQVVSHTLGVAHPTGYPLYILLGKLFTLLPIGNIAYRVNLISPLFASLAVVCLYLCLVYLTRHRVASLLATLTFAFSRTFWSQAVIAEVYTLNAFFVALVLYLLLKSKTDAWKLLAAFVYGLSLTNHLTMALLAPAMAIYALLTRPWTSPRKAVRNQVFGTPRAQNARNCEYFRPPENHSGQEKPGFSGFVQTPMLTKRHLFTTMKKVLIAAGLFWAGLSVYLYIPLRWPALHGRSMTLGEFANWVLGSRFRGALHWDAWLKDPERYLILARLILEQYSWVGLILGLLGLVWLFTKRRREAILLLVAYVAYLIYGLNYYVPDISAFIIPAHLIFAIWIGAGLHALWQAASSWILDIRYWILDSLLITCFSLLVTLPLLWTNLPQVDMSHHGWEAYRWGQYVLGLDLPPGAAILADSEKIAPLYYLQRVEGIRPDLDIIVMGDEAGYRQQLETRIAQGQPVYLARYLPGLEGRFHLRSLGPLVEVGTTPLTSTVLSPKSEVLGLKFDGFGQSIRLLGYNADSLTIEPPNQLRLTLFWQALSKIDTNYHVRLRLTSESGHVWLEEEGRHPVNGYYPTVAWRPGEIVPDFHELAISQALPPGTYRLEVGLFPPFSQEGVFVEQIGRVHVLEGEGWQSPEDLAIPYPLRASFAGELILLGYDRPSFVRPNGQATLTLYWQRLREGNTNYDIALRMVDEAGEVLWQENFPPLFSEYPTSRWRVGQIVQTSHDLAMPSTAGEVGLQVGLSLPDSGEMLAVRSHWLAPLSEWCPLRPIQVRSTPPAGGPAINFDNRILLLGHDLGRWQLRPGETLEISLTWQGLQRMDEDYTVFVHILDEEQRIWGQEDIGPVHGTYPTSQWKEGEIIEDIHTVRLSYEAPPGEYQIEVGLYLLSTMARLRVLDEEMRVVDDKVIIKMTNDQ
ncbi:MAG: DUF2723 domain-containing protein [Anaerolineales bacterium]|nr:DUF2723 domain-containing protein [Anaerolineales bacterium]